jgi:hypothetical protein
MCFLFSVSYVFGVFFVSILGSKLLHLWTHFFTVPTTAFILYLPTFFLFDLLAICLARLLLSQSRTPWAWIGSLLGSIATYVFLPPFLRPVANSNSIATVRWINNKLTFVT